MCVRVSIDWKRAKSFLELFNPTTNNWMVWLATASFSAFIYVSLSSVVRGGSMVGSALTNVILVTAFIFLGITIIAFFVLGYLVITWLKSVIKLRKVNYDKKRNNGEKVEKLYDGVNEKREMT